MALDPNSAVLNALIGDTYYSDARHGWTGEHRTAALSHAARVRARALDLDPATPDAYRVLAGIHLLRDRFEDAVEAARNGARLGPNLPDVLVFGGFVLTCAGHAAEPVRQVERAFALSPNHPAWHLGVLGNACRLSGQLEEAEAAFRGYNARSPGFGLADLIMIQEQTGNLEAARRTVGLLLAGRPTFTVSGWLNTQFRVDREQLELDTQSLRRSGVPER